MMLGRRFETYMTLMRTGRYYRLQMMSSAPKYDLDAKMVEVVILASEMEFQIIELQVQIYCILRASGCATFFKHATDAFLYCAG